MQFDKISIAAFMGLALCVMSAPINVDERDKTITVWDAAWVPQTATNVGSQVSVPIAVGNKYGKSGKIVAPQYMSQSIGQLGGGNVVIKGRSLWNGQDGSTTVIDFANAEQHAANVGSQFSMPIALDHGKIFAPQSLQQGIEQTGGGNVFVGRDWPQGDTTVVDFANAEQHAANVGSQFSMPIAFDHGKIVAPQSLKQGIQQAGGGNVFIGRSIPQPPHKAITVFNGANAGQWAYNEGSQTSIPIAVDGNIWASQSLQQGIEQAGGGNVFIGRTTPQPPHHATTVYDFANAGQFAYNEGEQTSIPIAVDGNIWASQSLQQGIQQLGGGNVVVGHKRGIHQGGQGSTFVLDKAYAPQFAYNEGTQTSIPIAVDGNIWASQSLQQGIEQFGGGNVVVGHKRGMHQGGQGSTFVLDKAYAPQFAYNEGTQTSIPIAIDGNIFAPQSLQQGITVGGGNVNVERSSDGLVDINVAPQIDPQIGFAIANQVDVPVALFGGTAVGNQGIAQGVSQKISNGLKGFHLREAEGEDLA